MTPPSSRTAANEAAYDELVTLIDASQGTFAPFIAACDDRTLRETLIARYAEELGPEILHYRLQLNRGEPSLRAAIAYWKTTHPNVIRRGRAVVLTVTGAEELLWLNIKADQGKTAEGEQPTEEKTELDKFFGYLQWTREAIGQYPYPIVLWVTHRVLRNLSLKAPDFWSWRKAVFRFSSDEFPGSPSREWSDPYRSESPMPSTEESAAEDTQLSLEDLQDLIAQTEQQQGTDAPTLATLYRQIAQVYATRVNRGEAANRQEETDLAIEFFQKAIALHTQHGDEGARAKTLNQLGNFYESQGQLQAALDCHRSALELAQTVGDRSGEAASLNNLGNAYHSLGQFSQAIELHQQALEIKRQLGDRPGEAASLNNLGIAYKSLGQFSQAIELYQQALEIKRQIGDRSGEAASLTGLGNAYFSLGQFSQAIELYQQALEIRRQIGDRSGEAASLTGLGNAYFSLGQFSQAIELHQQSLEIFRQIGNRSGEAASLNNLGEAYRALGQFPQAIELYQQSLEITRQIGDRSGEARSWHNLGLSLAKLNRKFEALNAFQTALHIFQDLGLSAEVDKCQQAIYGLERVVPIATDKAPKIIDEDEPLPRWWVDHQNPTPHPKRSSSSSSSTVRSLPTWAKFALGIAGGIALAIIIAWILRG